MSLAYSLDPAAPEAVLFRDAMAQLAGGVAVVACLDAGAPRGLLVSSLVSLSIEPPRMLFCVQKRAPSHPALLRAERCSLAILGHDDVEEAQRFSTRSRAAERFSPGAWRLQLGEPPHYAAALVNVTGRISNRMDAGSHSVFVLDVEAIHRRDGEPLVYFGRSYRTLSTPPDAASPKQTEPPRPVVCI
jgi:flavin reductase (DIM6/NTAB) family NADH-FMN oxidoreductase RutF